MLSLLPSGPVKIKILTLPFAFHQPSARYDLIFNMPLAKLYTNSLMSILNSRCTLKAAASHGSEFLGHSAQRSRVNVNVLRQWPEEYTGSFP